jgi:hypothetical protein
MHVDADVEQVFDQGQRDKRQAHREASAVVGPTPVVSIQKKQGPSLFDRDVRFVLFHNPVHCNCKKAIDEFCGSLQRFKVHTQISALIVLFDSFVYSLCPDTLFPCVQIFKRPPAPQMKVLARVRHPRILEALCVKSLGMIAAWSNHND